VSEQAFTIERVGPPGAIAKRIATSRVGRLSVPVNLFDIVTVVARKVRQAPPLQAH
jgi:hypothetical protein